MSGPWRFVWSWAGYTGEARDIAPVWRLSSDVFGVREMARQVTIEFAPIGVPAGQIDVPAEVARGGHLYTGFGTLYYDEEIVVAGPWRSPSYGRAGNPIRVTIGQAETQDLGLVPFRGDPSRRSESALIQFPNPWAALATSARYTTTTTGIDAYDNEDPAVSVVTTATWPGPTRKADGQTYPLVFGAPGSSTRPGTPALYVDTTAAAEVFVVAGHATGATTVTVWGPSVAGDPGSPLTSDAGIAVRTMEDALGTLVTVIDGPDLVNVQITADGLYFVSWTGGDALPGGAGDVLAYMLGASTLPIDWISIATVRPRLNAYVLAGFLNEPVTPSDWVQGEILPLLPVAMDLGPKGLRATLWPFLDQQYQPWRRVNLDTEAAPEAGLAVVYDTDVGVSDVTLAYAPDVSSGNLTRRATCRLGTNAYGNLAASIFGSVPAEAMESRWIWDDATAQAIASLQLRVRGNARRTVTTFADPSRYGPGTDGELRVGAPVLLYSTPLAFDGAPAMVGSVEMTIDTLRIEFILRDELFGGG